MKTLLVKGIVVVFFTLLLFTACLNIGGRAEKNNDALTESFIGAESDDSEKIRPEVEYENTDLGINEEADNLVSGDIGTNQERFNISDSTEIHQINLELNDMEIHFIDVAQGDSVLIISPTGNVMLVDAGDRSAGEKIVSYLKKAGITTINKFITTHPHADHIGGAQDIFSNFNVEKVYDSGYEHTTVTFENFLDTIIEKDIDFEIAVRGNKIKLDDALDITIMHPVTPMNEANNSSVVLKIVYGDFSVLLTGDSESAAEGVMLASGLNLEATVLKVGHHGSSTSTGQSFLNAINPEVAVIQVGVGNRYGHPSDTIIERLTDSKVKIYRNDKHGDIVITTNGATYSINASPYIHESIVVEADKPITTAHEEPKVEESVKEEPKVEQPKGTININTASFEELRTIKHIDVDRAQQIINLRPFKTISELTKVKGIGDSRLRDIIEEGKAYAY